MTTSSPPAADAVVEITDLTKRFGATTALDAVSLTVRRGEIVVLLGLSGSGKSTLLRHVDALEAPTSGAVRVLGEDVPALRGGRLRTLRGKVGFIFQQFELVPSLTVLENVLTGALAELRGPRLGLWSYPKAKKLRALQHLERVGLLERAYQRADTLSGGQQQRVAIARALMQNPSILLADEPVASLDPESSDQVMGLIREIAAEEGLTVLCSLHQVDLAISWADRIVGLRHGAVVLDTPAAGLSKAEVMEIYGRVATTTSELEAVQNELLTPEATR
ncbi:MULTISPECIES: phosphonate ABC transporter ATP-binding protein [unclassified Rathayibacter]|uniref:phosphonate ABC transporter ATP-binding protein n=1 Tax=unclassified Rathayibacter TaxID=2609250 RepID=UPI000F4CE1F1|nr:MULTISPECIES: phosphonate ABC transporter ATP-binding protein [unclassified Rathayibacter]MCJ1705479.1 phosphonate ABC transporter ATP-binding protein [Rathayibacter sp. VKM Ac-2926]ROQ58917.1 phosphonate transport system ATP-binding protein [Rathayibacter sp. PhB152]TCL83688.1 phosphonate transport system ATP-binding protein [Rathayibacter sp. PhB192]TCM29281.1 phosphonate transport system ATP-binding protein [Rathayibacter sp. PhB179]TDX79164.1 phosphonate transport system ATP-binding pro